MTFVSSYLRSNPNWSAAAVFASMRLSTRMSASSAATSSASRSSCVANVGTVMTQSRTTLPP